MLAGAYWTGPDVNTNSADAGHPRRDHEVRLRSVAGTGAPARAPRTLVGVFHSLLAAAEAANLGSSLEGLRVLVQGSWGGQPGRRDGGKFTARVLSVLRCLLPASAVGGLRHDSAFHQSRDVDCL